MSTFTLIDSPVDALSSLKAIDMWLAELEKMPQDDLGVQDAVRWAKLLREQAERRAKQ